MSMINSVYRWIVLFKYDLSCKKHYTSVPFVVPIKKGLQGGRATWTVNGTGHRVQKSSILRA